MRVNGYTKLGSSERTVLIGMIMDFTVLSKIAPHWTREGLFSNDNANIIASWCISFYKKRNNAPRSNIQTAFNRWVEKGNADKARKESVEHLLQTLSDQFVVDYDKDPEAVLEIAKDYFNEIRIDKAKEEADLLKKRGEIDKAVQILQAVRPIDFDQVAFLDPWNQPEKWHPVEIDQNRLMIAYKGALAEFFRGCLKKGEFYSFMAPDKTGKTTCLHDFTYRSIRKGNCTLYVDTGDGNEATFMRRLNCRASQQPWIKMKIKKPTGWDKEGNLQYEEQELEALNPAAAHRKFLRECKVSGGLRFLSYPNSSITVQELDGILEEWAKEGWVCDVMVIDYADILAPPAGIKDPLEQIDENWKQMSRLCQKRDLLLMTATQSSAMAYRLQAATDKKSVLGPQHFSGRKTKLAHVNGMIGINVTQDERQQQSSRWNWVRRRTADHSRPLIVHLAGCYDLENPCVVSRW